MGMEAIYPPKRTTIPGGASGVSPYRLRGSTSSLNDFGEVINTKIFI
jgi:hypothetical protein